MMATGVRPNGNADYYSDIKKGDIMPHLYNAYVKQKNDVMDKTHEAGEPRLTADFDSFFQMFVEGKAGSITTIDAIPAKDTTPHLPGDLLRSPDAIRKAEMLVNGYSGQNNLYIAPDMAFEFSEALKRYTIIMRNMGAEVLYDGGGQLPDTPETQAALHIADALTHLARVANGAANGYDIAAPPDGKTPKSVLSALKIMGIDLTKEFYINGAWFAVENDELVKL